jgi:hypothetical protein
MNVKIVPRIRDSRILSLDVKHTFSVDSKGREKCIGNFTIMDSLLVLPSSLEKLSKTFGCENKGMFPLKLLNEYLSFEYSGETPDIKYFFHPDPNKDKDGYKKFLNNYEKYKVSFVNKN